MAAHFVQPGTNSIEHLLGASLNHEYSLLDLVKRPEAEINGLISAAGIDSDDLTVNEQVEIDSKYQGYIDRQQTEIDRVQAQQDLKLPADLDYEGIAGLSNEVSEKLGQVKPETLGQAGRISGVTPAAISLLLIHIKKRGQNEARRSA